MTANTPRGITYAQSSDDTQLWIHLQNLATTADAAMDAVFLVVADAAHRPPHIAGSSRLIYQQDVGRLYLSDGATWRDLMALRTGSGTYSPKVTAAPPAGTLQEVQAGSVVVTLNSSGIGTVTFPHAFPNGVMSAVVTAGDTAGGLGFVISKTATLANVAVNCYAPGGAALGASTVRLDYVAVGW